MLRESVDRIAEANARDLAAAPDYGLTDAQIDRLRLTPKRIEEIAAGLEQIAELPDPIGEVIRTTVRPNGLRIDKVRVPLGVVFFIYESRPERDRRRGRDLRESRQRRDPSRRQGSDALQPGDRRLAARARPTKSACRPMPCSW